MTAFQTKVSGPILKRTSDTDFNQIFTGKKKKQQNTHFEYSNGS